MHNCKDGEEKCDYSHDMTYLPDEGFWTDQDGIQKLNEIFGHLEQDAKDAAAEGRGPGWKNAEDRNGGNSISDSKNGGARIGLTKLQRRELQWEEKHTLTDDELEYLSSPGPKPWDDDWPGMPGPVPEWVKNLRNG